MEVELIKFFKSSYTSIIGGSRNLALSNYGSVVGGFENVVRGRFSTVVGGSRNTANGRHSVAMGYSSIALSKLSFALAFNGDNNGMTSSETICSIKSEKAIKICADTILFNNFDLTAMLVKLRQLTEIRTRRALLYKRMNQVALRLKELEQLFVERMQT